MITGQGYPEATRALLEAPRGMVYDKPWFGCDNQRASPHAGQCYAIWDALPLRQGPFDVVYVSVSVDAGAHWSTPERTQNHARGFGAVPVIEPDGGIVVVYLDTTSYPFGLDAFTSVDGGATWGTSTRISVPHRTDVTGVRDPGFPSVAIDPSGEIYVVWSDCRFEPRCRSDQLVLSRSANGRAWSHPSAVGVAAPSGSSLLTPALAVRSHGHRDELGIIYLAVSAKGRVRINRVTSRDGDSGWSAPTPVGWRSRVRWFTPTRDGYFWGDYVTASFLANGRLIAVVPLARRPSRRLDVAMYAAIGS